MANANEILSTHFMLISYNTSLLPSQRKIKSLSAKLCDDAGATRGSGAAVKQMWAKDSCPAYEAVKAAVGQCKTLCARYGVPYDGGGSWLIKNTDIMTEFMPAIAKADGELQLAVNKFLADYDTHVQRQLDRMGELASIDEFPTASDVANWDWFGYKLRPVPNGDMSRVQGLEAAEYLCRQVRTQAEHEAEKLAADALTRCLDELQEKLNPLLRETTIDPVSDKRPRVYESTLENIKLAIHNVRSFNIYHDSGIAQVCNDLEQRVCNPYTFDQYKASDVARANLNDATNDILSKMSSLGI